VIETVTAAREKARHDAAAARATGDPAEARRFEAAAREAEERLERLRAIQDRSDGAEASWWI
jgi:hypothetical protein